MRRPLVLRFVLTILAFLAALAAPATAVAHGIEHAREAADRPSHGDAGRPGVAPEALTAPDPGAEHAALHGVTVAPQPDGVSTAAPVARCAHVVRPTTVRPTPTFPDARARIHASPPVRAASQPRAPPVG